MTVFLKYRIPSFYPPFSPRHPCPFPDCHQPCACFGSRKHECRFFETRGVPVREKSHRRQRTPDNPAALIPLFLPLTLRINKESFTLNAR